MLPYSERSLVLKGMDKRIVLDDLLGLRAWMVWEPLSLVCLSSHRYQMSLLTDLEGLGCPVWTSR